MYQLTKPFILCMVATAALLTGIICWTLLFPAVVRSKVKTGVVLENDSESMKRWLSPPTLDFKVYLFNVTNPNEVHIGGQPIVQEIGPYVYTERHDKEVIQYHDDDTISYNTRKTFIFNEQKSRPNNEADSVTFMNPALMGIILMVEDMMPFALPYVNDSIPYLFNQTTIFSTASVKEILFDGIRINCTHQQGFGKMACEALKGRTPDTMRLDSNSTDYLFSFLHHLLQTGDGIITLPKPVSLITKNCRKNDTTVGPFRVSRGRDNIKELGKIKMFEEKEELDIWPVNSTCNEIRGTDSTIFPPFLESTDPIYIYVPEVCGSLFAEFDSESSVNNIHVLKYVGSKKNFADPFKYSPNKCRCNGIESFQSVENVPEQYLVCPKDGAMFLQKCHKAPIVFSEPHFFSSDVEYVNFVKGLKPNRMDHETFVQIEPVSGIPLEGHKRLQMNMYLRNVSKIQILKDVDSGLMPILWIEEGFQLGDEHKSLLVTFYYFLTILKFFPWILILSGVAIFGYAFFITTSEKVAICQGPFASKISSVRQHVAGSGVNNSDNVRAFSQGSMNIANVDNSNTTTTLNDL